MRRSPVASGHDPPSTVTRSRAQSSLVLPPGSSSPSPLPQGRGGWSVCGVRPRRGAFGGLVVGVGSSLVSVSLCRAVFSLSRSLRPTL